MTNPLDNETGTKLSRKRSFRAKLAVSAMGLAGLAGAVAIVPAAASAQDATPAAVEQVDPLLQEVPQDEESENEGRRNGRRGHRGDRGAALAELLGLETDELRDAFQAGSTLAEVAEANGVDREALVDAIVTAKTEKINEKVASGDLDAADAQERLDGLEERVNERIDRVKGERGERGDRGPRGGDETGTA